RRAPRSAQHLEAQPACARVGQAESSRGSMPGPSRGRPQPSRSSWHAPEAAAVASAKSRTPGPPSATPTPTLLQRPIRRRVDRCLETPSRTHQGPTTRPAVRAQTRRETTTQLLLRDPYSTERPGAVRVRRTLAARRLPEETPPGLQAPRARRALRSRR